MSQEDTASVTQLLAKSNPRVLLDALRSNGFWIYALHKSDIDEAINGSQQDDMMPITDDDMDYVNRRDNNRSVVSQDINYEDITRNIIMEIRDYRNFKK